MKYSTLQLDRRFNFIYNAKLCIEKFSVKSVKVISNRIY